jgi:YD repeat-containing protein
MCPKPRFNVSKGLTLALPIALAGLLPASVRAQDVQAEHKYVSPWRTPWTYEGARGSDHWADLDPQYAACMGKGQSPIDIREAQRADLPALRFDYKSSLRRRGQHLESYGGVLWVQSAGTHEFCNRRQHGRELIYNALGQLIEKTVAGVTTLLMYDEAGHLLGEYSSTGALIQETVSMDDTPHIRQVHVPP